MEVTLIAMTDAVMPNYASPAKAGLHGGTYAASHVCDHAARICTAEDPEPMLTDDDTYLFWEDNDMKALKSAMRSGHESVLEHAVYTFEIRGVSRALTHQLVRHRVASFSQQSQRYVNMDGFGYVIPASISQNPDAFDDDTNLMGRIQDMYEEFVSEEGYNIPEEDARYILPNACTSNIVVTMNARELRHFFSLRRCNRAQWEIRQLATIMLEICKEVSPDLFADAGPRCEQLGYCPEAKSCGHMPKKEVKE